MISEANNTIDFIIEQILSDKGLTDSSHLSDIKQIDFSLLNGEEYKTIGKYGVRNEKRKLIDYDIFLVQELKSGKYFWAKSKKY